MTKRMQKCFLGANVMRQKIMKLVYKFSISE